MEIYEYLFRKNNFKVNDTGYFVYCNGLTDADAFDAKLCFDIKIIPYKGNTSWVDGFIVKAHQCLVSEDLPESSETCDFCSYHNALLSVFEQV